MEDIVTIETLDHQGRGISHVNGKVIFIENALPKEQIKIKITKDKKNYQEAQVIEWLTTSPSRTKPICPYFKECGGCDIMHMTYEEQLTFKHQKIKNIMKKYADLSEKVTDIIPSPESLHYRNKATFHIKNEKLGYYKKQSNDILSIEYCYLLPDKMNELLKKLHCENKNHIQELGIRFSFMNEELLVFLNNNKTVTLSPIANVSMITLNPKETVLWGKNVLTEQIGNLVFEISPTSFFQVNTKQTYHLYQLVKEYAHLNKEETVLDLYCGTGTIGLYVSNECKEILGIEKNKQAIKDAKRNQQINHIDNAQFISGDVDTILDKINVKPNCIIVDPPRSGLGLQNAIKLLTFQADKIIYVSCDPITLARDLTVLKEKYEIIKITPVDMFPQTSHVETVALMTRTDVAKG